MNEGTDESLRQALESFKEATKIDPQFARAHVAIGKCFAELGIRSYTSYSESLSGMKSAAKKALEIDENLADGHSMLAYVAWAEDDFDKDESEARRALELNPNLAEAYDILDKAQKEIESLERTAPSDMDTILFRGFLLAMKGDVKSAERIIKRLQREFRGGATLDRNIGYVRYLLGDMDAFFAAMFRASERHVLDPSQLKMSPLFKRARQDSRYRELMIKNGVGPDVKE